MKYQEGQELYFRNWSGQYTKCKVVKVLDNTNRYRINYISPHNGEEYSVLAQESDVFLTVNDGIDSEINVKKMIIEQLNKEIQTLETKRPL